MKNIFLSLPIAAASLLSCEAFSLSDSDESLDGYFEAPPEIIFSSLEQKRNRLDAFIKLEEIVYLPSGAKKWYGIRRRSLLELVRKMENVEKILRNVKPFLSYKYPLEQQKALDRIEKILNMLPAVYGGMPGDSRLPNPLSGLIENLSLNYAIDAGKKKLSKRQYILKHLCDYLTPVDPLEVPPGYSSSLKSYKAGNICLYEEASHLHSIAYPVKSRTSALVPPEDETEEYSSDESSEAP